MSFKAWIERDWPTLYWVLFCLRRPAYVRALARSPFVRWVPPGHFYSPLPSVDDIGMAGGSAASNDGACAGIDLREAEQINLLARLAPYHSAFPFSREPRPGLRFHCANDYFPYGDAVVAYSLFRLFEPRHVVEIGSGFSSALMLDVNELFNAGRAAFTFIEPKPERLLQLIGGRLGAGALLPQKVQEVPLTVFDALGTGDLLFVDSSHVVKAGSDVKYILFEVLPRLQSGVLVHFHDVFWPFEYPADWLGKGIGWNEAYFLRAFLQFNRDFEIIFFNAFMAARHAPELARALPAAAESPGSSLWLRRTDSESRGRERPSP